MYWGKSIDFYGSADHACAMNLALNKKSHFARAKWLSDFAAGINYSRLLFYKLIGDTNAGSIFNQFKVMSNEGAIKPW
jgi:hypothetical protein